MPKIGAHVSAAVSLETSFIKAQEIGAEATQIFIAPPRQWAQTEHDEAEIIRYREAMEQSGVSTNFIHGTYLVNLGTASPEHLQKSLDWLVYALNYADKLGSRGVIFHMGSHQGRGFEAVFSQIVESLREVLDSTEAVRGDSEESSQNGPQTLIPRQRDTESRTGFEIPRRQDPELSGPEETFLILENSAGAGGGLGATFQELGRLIKAVNNPRLKICLDTQHSFAWGYDLKSKIGLEDMLKEFDEEIGLENLVAIHTNDSKTEFRSKRDRHENIGEGFIGKEAFENMINHPKLNHTTFILEVPGFLGNGPDKENVDILKSLRKNN
jgi:deoxyribonuclease IV